MSSMLLFQEGIRLLTSILCFYISAQLRGRQLSEPEDRLAWNAFRVWWAGLGLTTMISLFNAILPLLGILNLTVYVALAQVNILVICIALWGLLSYLVFLFTGKANARRYLAIFYFLFFIALAVYAISLQPSGVELEEGVATIQYDGQVSPAYILVLSVFLLAPQLLASFAYFSFYFRVRERTQKYRVLLVSVSIFVWFSSPLLARALSLSEQDWWPLASSSITLIAAIVIYWAYYPPKFLQERLRVASV